MWKKASKNDTLQVYDTMRRSTGLRFFKLWLEIDIYGAIFIRHFTIGQRSFLGIVVQNNRQVHKGVLIYELVDSERLVLVQTLGGVTATSFRVFLKQEHTFIAVGHYYNQALFQPPEVTSQLYKWQENPGWFVEDSELQIVGVKDVDYAVLPDGNAFLAFATQNFNVSDDAPTHIFRHHESRGCSFFHVGHLTTDGASRVNFFTFNSTLYLFVAEECSVDRSYHTKSSIYRWNSTHFELFQKIDTVGAHDLLPFSIGDNFFVVAVNHRHNYSLNIQSRVYLMVDGVFRLYFSLETHGATKAEFFQIGMESFLVFSNSQDESVITNSAIYRVEGAKFVCVQEILTQNARYVHSFKTRDGSPVLAIANKAGKPRLYKWTSLSYSCTGEDC
jgi:hypothetical protein